MFLKKIEITGFKSFADRARLEFGDGVAAIIGPNGSGKSNISDAMKWVLGEQSVKSLRGSSMEDVIFNGTALRKPLSRASVSITISNERGILPITFKEVTVTRRIFRAGESQYLINDSECRLKDVVELFMDTGLSKGSYSIISQGQIGAILTANPYDRRAIFEEAAGIVKYKTRKKIALNKLDATKQDLLRVNDILLELERQIRSLKYQAAKAERYKILSERLESAEIYAKYLEYEIIRSEIEELKKIHLLNSDKKIAIESKINSQGSEYETGKLKLIELDNEINRLSEKIYSLSENIKTGEYKVLDNNGKINNYEFQIKQYNEDSIISENKLIELKNSISGMELELENLEKYFLETEIDKNKVIQELSEIENQSKEIEEQIEKHKIDAFVKSNKISAKKSDLSAIEAENKALKEQKEEIQITIAGSREKIYNLKNEIEILNQNAVQIEKNLNDSRTQTENEIAQKNGIQKHIDILNEKNLEYKNMLMNFKAELKVILDTEDDKYIDGLKDLLKEVSGNKIQIKFHGLVGENIRTSDRYEIAIGNALNEIVQTMIVDSRNDIEKAAGILNANSFGKVKLIEKNIPEEKRRSFENVDFSKEKGFIDFVPNVIKHTNSESKKIINSMFERFAITENFESGYELSREHPEYNFVALSGEIFWSDGSVTAGRVKETRNILKRDRQKNEFENNIRNSAAAIEETNKRIEELNVSLKNSESNIETYLKQSRELDIELLNCKKNIEMKERQLIDLTEDIDKYVEKENSIENKHKELYEKSKEINIQISNYLRETEELNSKANELIQKNNEVKLKRNGLFDSATSVKIKSAEMNQKKENLKQTIVNFKKSAEEFSSKILENKNNCEICLKNSEEIRKENGNIDNKLKESIKEHDINIENRKALQARRENEGGIIANIENLNKNYQKELNEFQNKIHEIEIGLSQKETKTAGIFESVYSRYSISQEDFIGKKWFEKICEELKNEFSGKNVEELKEEVRAVEQKIKSLGPVNINAIEEFKEVSERFEFLNSQKNDLETAEKDLINVINKINARAKEKFIDTFYKVNENFKEIIKQLFEGGEAELNLIDESDALESGIEINVRPPGKKVQNIMLLSGGEKAMAAIGLLFALFKVKPSPFCILDEIDAPLDDANISRFLKLLRDFSQNSQFVIITHHKKTMATCDVLYGITMEEKGVSKVLSVKITDNKKIEELAG